MDFNDKLIFDLILNGDQPEKELRNQKALHERYVKAVLSGQNKINLSFDDFVKRLKKLEPLIKSYLKALSKQSKDNSFKKLQQQVELTGKSIDGLQKKLKRLEVLQSKQDLGSKKWEQLQKRISKTAQTIDKATKALKDFEAQRKKTGLPNTAPSRPTTQPNRPSRPTTQPNRPSTQAEEGSLAAVKKSLIEARKERDKLRDSNEKFSTAQQKVNKLLEQQNKITQNQSYKKLRKEIDLSANSIEGLRIKQRNLQREYDTSEIDGKRYKQLQLRLKEVNSELKRQKDAVKENNKSLGGINGAVDFASGSYGKLRQQIKTSRDELQKFPITSKQYQKEQAKLNGLLLREIEIRKDQPSLFKTRITQAINESKAVRELSFNLAKLENQREEVRLSLGKNSKEYKKLNKQIALTNIRMKALSKTSGLLKSATAGLAVGLAAGFALDKLVEGIKSTIKVGAEFGQGLANLQAISGASAAELDKLEKKALALSQASQFTARQVVDLQTALARLGFTSKEITDLGQPIINLSTATGEAVQETAKVVGQTVRAYGLATSEAEFITDVFAKAFNTSALTLGNFAEASKLLAPSAQILKFSVQEATAAIGFLTNAGLEGTISTQTIGTSLQRLSEDNKKYAKAAEAAGIEVFKQSGEFVGLAQLVENTRIATKNLTDEDKLATLNRVFGAQSAKNFALLLEAEKKVIQDGIPVTLKGGEAIKAYAEELGNAGGEAKRVADIQRNTLFTSYKFLLSAIEAFQITLQKTVDGPLRGFVEGVTDGVNALTRWVSVPLSRELIKQSSELQFLTSTLNDNIVSDKEKISTIKEMASKYPDLISQEEASLVTSENLDGAVKSLTERTKDYLTQLRNRIQLEASREALQKAERKAIDAEAKSLDKRAQILEASAALEIQLGLGIDFAKFNGDVQAYGEAVEKAAQKAIKANGGFGLLAGTLQAGFEGASDLRTLDNNLPFLENYSDAAKKAQEDLLKRQEAITKASSNFGGETGLNADKVESLNSQLEISSQKLDALQKAQEQGSILDFPDEAAFRNGINAQLEEVENLKREISSIGLIEGAIVDLNARISRANSEEELTALKAELEKNKILLDLEINQVDRSDLEQRLSELQAKANVPFTISNLSSFELVEVQNEIQEVQSKLNALNSIPTVVPISTKGKTKAKTDLKEVEKAVKETISGVEKEIENALEVSNIIKAEEGVAELEKLSKGEDDYAKAAIKAAQKIIKTRLALVNQRKKTADLIAENEFLSTRKTFLDEVEFNDRITENLRVSTEAQLEILKEANQSKLTEQQNFLLDSLSQQSEFLENAIQSESSRLELEIDLEESENKLQNFKDSLQFNEYEQGRLKNQLQGVLEELDKLNAFGDASADDNQNVALVSNLLDKGERLEKQLKILSSNEVRIKGNFQEASQEVEGFKDQLQETFSQEFIVNNLVEQIKETVTQQELILKDSLDKRSISQEEYNSRIKNLNEESNNELLELNKILDSGQQLSNDQILELVNSRIEKIKVLELEGNEEALELYTTLTEKFQENEEKKVEIARNSAFQRTLFNIEAETANVDALRESLEKERLLFLSNQEKEIAEFKNAQESKRKELEENGIEAERVNGLLQTELTNFITKQKQSLSQFLDSQVEAVLGFEKDIVSAITEGVSLQIDVDFTLRESEIGGQFNSTLTKLNDQFKNGLISESEYNDKVEELRKQADDRRFKNAQDSAARQRFVRNNELSELKLILEVERGLITGNSDEEVALRQELSNKITTIEKEKAEIVVEQNEAVTEGLERNAEKQKEVIEDQKLTIENYLNSITEIIGFVQEGLTLLQAKADIETQNQLNQINVQSELLAQSIENNRAELDQALADEESIRDRSLEEQVRRLEEGSNKEITLLKNKIALEEQQLKNLDKQKEKIEKEAFERNKKFAIAQALLNGALAVTAVFTVPDFTFGIATAIQLAFIAASVAAQIGKINSTSFGLGGEIDNRQGKASRKSDNVSSTKSFSGGGQTSEPSKLQRFVQSEISNGQQITAKIIKMHDYDKMEDGGRILGDGLRVKSGYVPERKGFIRGGSHASGKDVETQTASGRTIRMEGGEISTVNGSGSNSIRHVFARPVGQNSVLKKMALATESRRFDPMASVAANAINQMGGGQPFSFNKGGAIFSNGNSISHRPPFDLFYRKLEEGGVIQSSDSSENVQDNGRKIDETNDLMRGMIKAIRETSPIFSVSELKSKFVEFDDLIANKTG